MTILTKIDKHEGLIYYIHKILFIVIMLLSVTTVDALSYWVYLLNDNPGDIPIDRSVLDNDEKQRHYRLRSKVIIRSKLCEDI